MREFVVHIDDNGKVLNEKAVNAEFEKLTAGKWLFKITSIKRRSLNQNAYYWACVVPLVKEGLINAGYDEIKTGEDAHGVMKHLFLKKPIVSKKDGNIIEIAGHTKELTALEFSEYLESIYKWAGQYLGIYIPPPGQAIPMFDSPLICNYDNEISSTIVNK